MTAARAIKLGFLAAVLVPVIWIDFWFLERERRRAERASGRGAWHCPG